MVSLTAVMAVMSSGAPVSSSLSELKMMCTIIHMYSWSQVNFSSGVGMGGGGGSGGLEPPKFFSCTKRFIACFMLEIKF